jgi:hypothetical protein
MPHDGRLSSGAEPARAQAVREWDAEPQALRETARSVPVLLSTPERSLGGCDAGDWDPKGRAGDVAEA